MEEKLMFGLVWAGLGRFGAVWTGFGQFRSVWYFKVHEYLVFSNLTSSMYLAQRVMLLTFSFVS